MCVCERERERVRVCETDVAVCRFIDAESEKNIFIIIYVTLSPIPLYDLIKHLELLRIGV